MPILAVGKTNIGQKRKTNQDSICILPEHLFFAVADGMGGHNGGDIASQMSVKFYPQFLNQNKNVESKELMRCMISENNKKVYAMAQDKPELKGMGTTVCAILFRGPNLYVANVGDSRTYMLHKKRLYQLTSDHSLVQEKINLGIYDRTAAAKDKMKNVLVRTVGFEADVEVDVFNYQVCRHDIFLTCSDGLHAKVSDRIILEIINHHIPNPDSCDKAAIEKTVDTLIDEANQRGGDDNISVILSVTQ